MTLDGDQLMYGAVNVGMVYREVDGYYVWVPPQRGGGYTEGDILDILNFLRELNKPWDEEVRAFFEG